MAETPAQRNDTLFYRVAQAAVVFFLLVGLFNLGRYSYTIDEPAVIRRGQASLKFVQSLFDGKRISNGPEVQAFWAMYHPPLYGMMNAAVSNLLEIRFGVETVMARHFLNVVWATVGLWFLFLLGRRLFGAAAGLAALLFMILFPRFIAHAHYNPKDIPTMVWGIIAIYYLVIFQDRPSIKNAVAAGMAVGFGVATGLNILFLLPVCALCVMTANGPYLRAAAVLVVAMMASAVLAWPQLWVRPAHFFQAVRFFTGSEWWPYEVLYFGRAYLAKDLPWHYIPAHVLMTTPLATLVFAVGGVLRSIRARKRIVLFMLLLWLLLPILARSRSGLIRYDEMRHVFLAIPPLVLLAGAGAVALLNRVPTKAAALVALALIGYHVKDIARLHPYEGSYYNEAVRFIIPAHIENVFPMAPWGSTCRQTVDWFNNNAAPDSHVCLSCEQSPLWYEFRSDLVIDCGAPDYNSFVTNHIWTDQIGEFQKMQPLYTESRYGSDLFYIYESTSAHEKNTRHSS